MSAPRSVDFMCSTTTCPAVGTWVDVDAAAVAFAKAERIPITCRGCRKPLALIPRRRPATTSQGATR